MKTYYYTCMPSPVGELTLLASDAGLAAVLWPGDAPGRVKLAPRMRDDRHTVLCAAKAQLTEYFAGQRSQFDLPLDMQGTDFQKRVWQALLTIPFGQTRSYRDIAQQVGNVKAVRAVGAANGRNPISIITPCHRVVGNNGTLTGFAGGLSAKAFLLEHEAARAEAPRAA